LSLLLLLLLLLMTGLASSLLLLLLLLLLIAGISNRKLDFFTSPTAKGIASSAMSSRGLLGGLVGVTQRPNSSSTVKLEQILVGDSGLRLTGLDDRLIKVGVRGRLIKAGLDERLLLLLMGPLDKVITLLVSKLELSNLLLEWLLGLLLG
jgi:hypothetical protein